MAERKCDNKAILKALRTEENWAEIGRQHDISRERVRRIAAAHGVKKRMSFETAVALVQPFLEHANREFCWRCGAELQPRKQAPKFCTRCLNLSKAIGKAKYFLRAFITTGSHFALAQAAYIIRKNGLSPEDFKRIPPKGGDKTRGRRARMHLDSCRCPDCTAVMSISASKKQKCLQEVENV